MVTVHKSQSDHISSGGGRKLGSEISLSGGKVLSSKEDEIIVSDLNSFKKSC